MSKRMKLLGLVCLLSLAVFQVGCASSTSPQFERAYPFATATIMVNVYDNEVTIDKPYVDICVDDKYGSVEVCKEDGKAWQLNWKVVFSNDTDKVCGGDGVNTFPNCYVVVGSKDRQSRGPAKKKNGRIYPTYPVLKNGDNQQGKPKPPINLGRPNSRRFEYFIEAYVAASSGNDPELIDSIDPEIMPNKP